MGGKSQQVKTYSPMEQAQASDYTASQQDARDKQAAADAQAKADADKAAAKATRDSELARIYGSGQSYGTSQQGGLGFTDTYGILDRYNTALSSAYSRVPEATTDVGSFFNYADMWNAAKTEAQSAERSRLNTAYGNLTKPGWETNYFADTADDPILEAILAEQKAEAEGTLGNARARGQLSQGAYDYAGRSLGNAATGARSTLEDLGLGVLGGYREDLGGIADEYGNLITNYQLGSNVNMDDFTGQLRSKADTLTGRMKGDIYNVVGDKELFDVNSLMAKGGKSAGAQNNPLLGAFGKMPADEALKTEQDRTTGTVGIF